jgi:integrase/recombinase XerC
MDQTRHLHGPRAYWLSEQPLAPYVDAFTRRLTERGYARHTIDGYLAGLAHFAQWMHRCRLRDVCQIDQPVVARFLDEHLPRCDCEKPVRSDRRDLRAALGHLLVVLRSIGVVAEPPARTTPVDEELRHFDEHMDRVRGLAAKTRSMALRIVRRLLVERFADRPIAISAIKPEHVRSFFARQRKLYRTPANAGTVIAALRGYFRYRTSCGDAVHGLIGAVSYPANWQLASLPKALTGEEVERLVNALGHGGPSMRRADAIVRCALDLGLRSCEIAKLSLDDIDWGAGTITLRRTKSRRQDVLPLPATTGWAIADYLKHERPKTSNRAVFVRHIAPRDEPIGPDLVRKAIRQAYARAGLPHTRSHLLRHTMANRLLQGGSSLKEVADVLRHRSLNTTLIYAKLDSRNLRAVALPWPGSES